MKKVFIDGGAHKGEAIEVLLDKRPDLAGCDIHFFEPNPDLIELLKDMAGKDENYNINVHHSALWIDNGGIDFIESVGRWNTLASTVVSSMKEIWGLKLDRKNSKSVPSKSLSEFISMFDEEDYLVVKLDIGGSEYYVIDDLFSTGSINQINELYIEWHDHFFPHLTNKGNELRTKLSKLNITVRNDWM